MKQALLFILVLVAQSYSLQWELVNPQPVLDDWLFVTHNPLGNLALGFSYSVLFSKWNEFKVAEITTNQTLSNYQAQALCATNNFFVAAYSVNNGAHQANIFTSTDGGSWELSFYVPWGINGYQLICSDTTAYIVGTNNPILWTTTDGSKWNTLTPQTLPSFVQSYSYSNGYFVAITSYGGNYSTDFNSWLPINLPQGANYADGIAIINKMLVFIGWHGVYTAPMSSYPFDWTLVFQNPENLDAGNLQCWGSSNCVFHFNDGNIYFTQDLTHWNLLPKPVPQIYSMTVSDKYGMLISDGSSLFFSNDETNWETNSWSATDFLWISAGKTVGLAYDTVTLHQSIDNGQTWNPLTLNQNTQDLLTQTRSVTFIPALNMFFGVTQSAQHVPSLGIGSFDNGATWKIVLDTQKQHLPGVTILYTQYNSTGVFVLSCTPNQRACFLLYSKDGNSWVELSNPLISDGLLVTNYKGQEVILGINVNQVFLSHDGIRWQLLNNVNPTANCFANGFSMFTFNNYVVAAYNCAVYGSLDNLNTQWELMPYSYTSFQPLVFQDNLYFFGIGATWQVEVFWTNDFNQFHTANLTIGETRGLNGVVASDSFLLIAAGDGGLVRGY